MNFLKLIGILIFLSEIFHLTDQANCGVPAIKPIVYGKTYSKIINGQKAIEGSWPWIVSLRVIMKNGSFSHNCGGSLIDTDLVLTAAHCINGLTIRQFIVVVGTYDAKAQPDQSYVYAIKEYKIHSSYSLINVKYGYDIALIKLNKPVTLSAKVGIICLPNFNDSDTILSKDLVTAGWYFLNL